MYVWHCVWCVYVAVCDHDVVCVSCRVYMCGGCTYDYNVLQEDNKNCSIILASYTTYGYTIRAT